MPQVMQSPQADDDLVNLFVYLGRRSPAAARVRSAIARLAHSPKLGRERPDLGPDLRSYHASGTYVIYYYTTNAGIEIARVLPGAL